MNRFSDSWFRVAQGAQYQALLESAALQISGLQDWNLVS